jgi:hypothetical protein
MICDKRHDPVGCAAFFVSVRLSARLCLAFSRASRVYKSDLYIESPLRHYSEYKSFPKGA